MTGRGKKCTFINFVLKYKTKIVATNLLFSINSTWLLIGNNHKVNSALRRTLQPQFRSDYFSKCFSIKNVICDKYIFEYVFPSLTNPSAADCESAGLSMTATRGDTILTFRPLATGSVNEKTLVSLT